MRAPNEFVWICIATFPMCGTPLSPKVRAGFPSGELISCVQSESGPSSRNGAKEDKTVEVVEYL